MKLFDSEKHYITEYYLRNGYKVERIWEHIYLDKEKKTDMQYEGSVRKFIEVLDNKIKNE